MWGGGMREKRVTILSGSNTLKDCYCAVGPEATGSRPTEPTQSVFLQDAVNQLLLYASEAQKQVSVCGCVSGLTTVEKE